MTEAAWVEDLKKSATLKDRAGKATKQAGILLWKGAKVAITDHDSSLDPDGEALYNEVKEALGGESRRGDASKVRTVAIAVDGGLDLAETVVKAGKKILKYQTLSAAYAEAVRLTKTVAEEAVEDNAAEVAISEIDAPKTASTPESAALVLLSKGVDGAVVAILDALNGPTGENNVAAHRAFLRALTSEVAARVKPIKPEKVEADEAAKPVQPKRKPTKTAPVKATATKSKPVQKDVRDEAVQDDEQDMFSDVDSADDSADDSVDDVAVMDAVEGEIAPASPEFTRPGKARPGKARPALKRPARR